MSSWAVGDDASRPTSKRLGFMPFPVHKRYISIPKGSNVVPLWVVHNNPDAEKVTTKKELHWSPRVYVYIYIHMVE